jgi:scyllo-inositol 2-dehydrogenase (NADP+)
MTPSFREPIRVGIVGLGRAGWGMHCPELDNYPGLFRIAAVCDPLKDRRDLAVARYPHCRAYRRFEDLLLDGDVELVDIATRSEDHVAHAVKALKTGRWVNLESPISLDADQALVLRAASIRAGNRLFARLNRRYEPVFVHVCEIIASGLLGDIHTIRLRRGAYSRRDDWQTVQRCGGGQLLGEGLHLIDQAIQMLESAPVRMWSDLKRVSAMGDAEDTVSIIMRNLAGLTVDLEISGGRVIPVPAYTVTGEKGELAATDAMITLKHLDPKHAAPRRRASVRTPPLGDVDSMDDLRWIEQQIPVAPQSPASQTLIWEHLANAIRLNKPYPVTLDQAVEVMRIITSVRKDSAFA